MVRLRRDGAKRNREEIQATAPVRGDLAVYEYRGVRSAFLLPNQGRADPLMLEGCTLTRMNPNSFIVVGHEVEHHRGTVRKQLQAWWCRLPSEALTTKELLDLAPEATREERRAARMAR